jgi:hypothetical protein
MLTQLDGPFLYLYLATSRVRCFGLRLSPASNANAILSCLNQALASVGKRTLRESPAIQILRPWGGHDVALGVCNQHGVL